MGYPATYPATYPAGAGPSGSFEIDVTAPVSPGAKGPWRFLLAAPQPAGTYLAEITQAASRTLTMRAGPGNFSEAAFDTDGYSPPALLVDELQADLQVMFGSQLLFCGRLGGTQDAFAGDGSYRLQPTAMDYRQVLRRRSLAYGGGPPFTAADISDIAWDLIQAGAGGDPGIQQYPAGNLGIARGHGATGLGIVATINYIRQDFTGSVIDALCQLTPGADWDITPYGQADLRLDMWTPARGADNGVIFTWGDGQVASITRITDPSAYANSVFVTGQSGLANSFTAPSAGALDVTGITARIEGRWDQVIGTQHTSQTSLDKAAAWYLNDAQVISPSYSVVLHPGMWQGPDWLSLGDLVTIRIGAGRLAVNDKLPVTEMAFDINSTGVETLTMNVGRLPFLLHTKIPSMLRRLKRLETQ
jgi:hypothetical protein